MNGLGRPSVRAVVYTRKGAVRLMRTRIGLLAQL